MECWSESSKWIQHSIFQIIPLPSSMEQLKLLVIANVLIMIELSYTRHTKRGKYFWPTNNIASKSMWRPKAVSQSLFRKIGRKKNVAEERIKRHWITLFNHILIFPINCGKLSIYHLTFSIPIDLPFINATTNKITKNQRFSLRYSSFFLSTIL